MMMVTRLLPTLAVFIAALNQVLGQQNSSLTWTVPAGGELLSFSGQMNIAVLNDPNKYEAFVGISSSDNPESVLSTYRSSGSNWSVWTHSTVQLRNFTTNTSSSNGGHTLSTSSRDLVNFEFTKVDNGWTGTTQRARDGRTKMQSFFPTNHVMTEVIFQITYVSGAWTSGSLSFNNVHMLARTSDQTWCSKLAGGSGTEYEMGYDKVSRQGPNGVQVKCDIDKITMLHAR